MRLKCFDCGSYFFYDYAVELCPNCRGEKPDPDDEALAEVKKALAQTFKEAGLKVPQE